MARTSECLSVFRRRIQEAAVSEPQLERPRFFFTTAPSIELNDRKGANEGIFNKFKGLFRPGALLQCVLKSYYAPVLFFLFFNIFPIVPNASGLPKTAVLKRQPQ